jgi:hypothetical protein
LRSNALKFSHEWIKRWIKPNPALQDRARIVFDCRMTDDPAMTLSTIPDIFELIEMTRNMSVVLYAVLLIAVVVGVDFLFFKNRFWERLMANIGIVLVFAAFYFRFLKKP